jgi:excisionase family DNA binding protein
VFSDKFIDELANALTPALAARIEERLGNGGVTPRYLNLEQAAVYLSTTPDGVRGMLRAKRFPARQIGKRVFVDRNDIDKAMDEGMQWL